MGEYKLGAFNCEALSGPKSTARQNFHVGVNLPFNRPTQRVSHDAYRPTFAYMWQLPWQNRIYYHLQHIHTVIIHSPFTYTANKHFSHAFNSIPRLHPRKRWRSADTRLWQWRCDETFRQLALITASLSNGASPAARGGKQLMQKVLRLPLLKY